MFDSTGWSKHLINGLIIVEKNSEQKTEVMHITSLFLTSSEWLTA